MIRILPTKFSGKLAAPPSKLHAQGVLFMAAMATFPSKILGVPQCDDIDTTLQCLVDLGCKVQLTTDNTVYIDPFPRNVPVPKADFDFRDSATCARYAMTLAASQGFQANCTASANLQKRKMIPLTSRMALRGVTFSKFSLPLSISGRLEGGEYLLESEEGAQNASALLLALPTLREASEIKLDRETKDLELLGMTERSLDTFGIFVERTKTGYIIPGRQIYQTPGEIKIENDWAFACMWLLAGACSGNVNGGVTITGLTNRSPKGYQDLQPLLALVSQDFYDFNFDASHCPNLASILAAMCIVKGSSLTITGVPQLKHKETDRLHSLAKIAKQLGQKAQVTDDGIIIEGCEHPNYEEDILVDCYDDPWVFMSMALAACVAEKPFCLPSEDGADKIYRDFFPDYIRLGGNYEVVEE